MTNVFLLAGQSNMVGAGVTAELPEKLRRTPANVRLYRDGALGEIAPAERFGPEVGFAHELAARLPEQAAVLCKVARGGANVYYDWNPDRTTGGPEDEYRGPMYPALLDAMRDAQECLAEEGEESHPAAMLWMQGERDSVFEFMAAEYEANLTAFIARVRADLGEADLPFLIGRICTRSRKPDGGYVHPFRDRVREAQARVAHNVPGAALLPTDDLPQCDALHFDTEGQAELGGRFARAWLAITEDSRRGDT